MSNGTLALVSAKTAAEVCKHFHLGEEAQKLLKPEQGPQAFLDLLIEKQQFADAARFLAHAMPKREAIWWASQVARQVAGPSPSPAVATALRTVETWVASPTEENRRPAMAAAEAAELTTPAGCAAAAVFFSGGSLAPPEVKPMPPGEWLTAQAVTGAIMLAPVLREPEKAPEKYRKFLALGIEVARGTSKWKP